MRYLILTFSGMYLGNQVVFLPDDLFCYFCELFNHRDSDLFCEK